MISNIWKDAMVQTHILQTCWWEVNGNEFEASEKK